MHRCHQGVKKNKRSGLGESFSEESSSSSKNISNRSSYPLCPKPRRIQPASAMPDLLNPLPSCSKHKSDKYVGILSLIPDSNSNNKKGERSEVCSCCWSCGYSGSPPGRTENPLVRDVRFIKEQMDHLISSHISDQFAFAASTTSACSNPCLISHQ